MKFLKQCVQLVCVFFVQDNVLDNKKLSKSFVRFFFPDKPPTQILLFLSDWWTTFRQTIFPLFDLFIPIWQLFIKIISYLFSRSRVSISRYRRSTIAIFWQCIIVDILVWTACRCSGFEHAGNFRILYLRWDKFSTRRLLEKLNDCEIVEYTHQSEKHYWIN